MISCVSKMAHSGPRVHLEFDNGSKTSVDINEISHWKGRYNIAHKGIIIDGVQYPMALNQYNLIRFWRKSVTSKSVDKD